jgi:hypothetical protein
MRTIFNVDSHLCDELAGHTRHFTIILGLSTWRGVELEWGWDRHFGEDFEDWGEGVSCSVLRIVCFFDSLTECAAVQDENRACVLGYLALTMLPAGYFVGLLSSKMSDRRILAISITWTAFACIPLYLLGSSSVHKVMYIFGGVMLHMSVVGIEGSSMSLLSKVIHPCMARGPVNCGLLTTVAGTVGRLWGNIMVRCPHAS